MVKLLALACAVATASAASHPHSGQSFTEQHNLTALNTARTGAELKLSPMAQLGNTELPMGTHLQAGWCHRGYIQVTTVVSADTSNHSHIICDHQHMGRADNSSATPEQQLCNHNVTRNSCEKCPANTHSNGGTNTKCVAMADDWVDCTHIGCKIVQGGHCATHAHNNPKQGIADGDNMKLGNCFGHGGLAAGGTNTYSPSYANHAPHISVFHHGHEHAGMQHKCMTIQDAGGVTDCLCKCKRGFSY